ncbi:MAG: hypothetical protein H6861_04620 [Rhodospirillales bacterium]|nr:hypothetical protein [Rhodospirillales bacterium]
MSVQNLGFIKIDFTKSAEELLADLGPVITQMAEDAGYGNGRTGIVRQTVQNAIKDTLHFQQFNPVGCHILHNRDQGSLERFSYSLQYGEPT